MMTAEQSVEEQFAAWYKANYGHIAATSSWVERARVSYMAGRESAAAQLAEKERERLDEYDVRPFDKLPKIHAEHVNRWLKSNDKKPADVRWSLYPIGMVGRWIERAEAAEQRLQEAQAEIKRLHKLFGDLTPGGSEFTGDPDYCAKYLRERANSQADLLKKKFIELRQREAELEQLRAQRSTTDGND